MAAVHNMMAASGDGYVTAELTIASNVNNYVLNTAKVANYVPGATRVVLTIDAGVVVGSGSPGSPALTIDTSWAARDKVEIINSGYIVGAGGAGGESGSPGNNAEYFPAPPFNPVHAGGGGTALLANRAAAVANQGVVGGGGGGGGARSATDFLPNTGGGGAGQVPGAGGGGVSVVASRPGTLTTGGASAGSDGTPMNGGSGGNLGQPGQATYTGSIYDANPGAAGYAVIGNSNITWIATGTRLGAIT